MKRALTSVLQVVLWFPVAYIVSYYLTCGTYELGELVLPHPNGTSWHWVTSRGLIGYSAWMVALYTGIAGAVLLTAFAMSWSLAPRPAFVMMCTVLPTVAVPCTVFMSWFGFAWHRLLAEFGFAVLFTPIFVLRTGVLLMRIRKGA